MLHNGVPNGTMTGGSGQPSGYPSLDSAVLVWVFMLVVGSVTKARRNLSENGFGIIGR